MTKKHFKALAEALRANRPANPGIVGAPFDVLAIQWQGDCREVARVCARFNGNFDYNRFIDACEGR